MKLDELEKLQLTLLTERKLRLELQVQLMTSSHTMVSNDLDALMASLKNKYSITDQQTIDLNTGEIADRLK
jgi:hypothetical protein